MAEARSRQFQDKDSIFKEIAPPGKLAALLSFWQGLVPSGLPGRQHLDPIAIGTALLPYVFLADVLDGGERFRWRLIGTHIVSHAGADETGKELGATVAPGMREAIIGHYRQVARERQPLCHRSEFVGQDGRVYRYDRLLLPMASDGAAVDMILGGAVFGQIRAS